MFDPKTRHNATSAESHSGAFGNQYAVYTPTAEISAMPTRMATVT